MVEYPYGRSGEPLCYYNDAVSEAKLKKSSEVGDNELELDGSTAYLYEAPSEDDTGRGHFSVWERTHEDRFEQVEGVSGDDGMCYEKFEDRK